MSQESGTELDSSNWAENHLRTDRLVQQECLNETQKTCDIIHDMVYIVV